MAKAQASTELQPKPQQEVAQSPAQGETAAILGFIERAARDPSVDMDKFERLFLMKERIEANAKEAAFNASLSAMQADMPVIIERGTISLDEKNQKGEKTGNKIKQSSYALWEDVNEKIRPVLTKHGFALTFRIDQPEDRSNVTVTAVLSHSAGHSERTAFSLPIESSGSKNNVQGWGSSVSYGKRYTAFALINIASRGEDDDGKKAGLPAAISPEQSEELAKLVSETGAEIGAVLEHYEIESLSDLPTKYYAPCKAKLVARKQHQAREAKQEKPNG